MQQLYSVHNRLTATTFPLESLNLYLSNLLEWKTISRTVLVLISSPDASSNHHLLELLQQHGFYVYVYDQPSTYKTPSLNDIILAFRQYPSHNYYSFVNADIEIIPESLLPALLLFQSPKHVLFASRQDYSSLQYPKTYASGFDYFSIPSSLLPYFTLPSLHRFFIGQVGWDYYLPLSLPKHLVQFTYSLPLYHLIHPTGSYSSWEQSILDIFPDVHYSWLVSQNYSRRIISNLCELLYKTCIPLVHMSPLLQAPINYLLARTIFYGCLQSLFQKNMSFEGICT